MLHRLFQRLTRKREIYFHEDDYCQQQLLPHAALVQAQAQLENISEFASAHEAPGGVGWTDVYVREEGPVEFASLGITRVEFEELISPILPEFDVVYTGYSSHREVCKRTSAWGVSRWCALFADWDENGVIKNVWSSFFDDAEPSLRAAARAVAALARRHPLVYVDWAWGYTCDASSEEEFVAMLRSKLATIAERRNETKISKLH